MRSTSNKKLLAYQLKQVVAWLEKHNLAYNERRLLRDFSDGVNVSKILKSIHPKLVDLHSYPSCCNTGSKVNNWKTLNFKVLRKIGLSLSQKTLEKLARGDQMSIEGLLYDILRHERVEHVKRSALHIPEREMYVSDVMKIKVKKQLEHAPKNTVPYSFYEDALRRRELLNHHINEVRAEIDVLETVYKMNSKYLKYLHGELLMHSKSSLGKPKELDCFSVDKNSENDCKEFHGNSHPSAGDGLVQKN